MVDFPLPDSPRTPRQVPLLTWRDTSNSTCCLVCPNILSCRSLRKLTQIFFSSSILSPLSSQRLAVPPHHIGPLFHQQTGVGVRCMAQDILKISTVHHLSLVQDHNPVRHPGDGV